MYEGENAMPLARIRSRRLRHISRWMCAWTTTRMPFSSARSVRSRSLLALSCRMTLLSSQRASDIARVLVADAKQLVDLCLGPGLPVLRTLQEPDMSAILEPQIL